MAGMAIIKQNKIKQNNTMDIDLAFCVQVRDKTIPYSENYYKIPPLLH
jgi:hypothetical protein